MSASSLPAAGTIAIQLSEALERYQRDFEELAESWVDTAHYRTVSSELQQIRTLKVSLPELSQEMADVLIRHAELVQAAWKAQIRHQGDAAIEMKQLRQRHAASVEAMRRKCLLLSAASRADGGFARPGLSR
jgi:hypothetical protein